MPGKGAGPSTMALHGVSIATALWQTLLKENGLHRVFLQSHTSRHVLPECLASRILYQLVKPSANFCCLEAPLFAQMLAEATKGMFFVVYVFLLFFFLQMGTIGVNVLY